MTTRVQLSRPVLEAELSARERPSGSPSREYGGEVVVTDGANAGRLSWVGVQEPHAEDWGTLVPRGEGKGGGPGGKGGRTRRWLSNRWERIAHDITWPETPSEQQASNEVNVSPTYLRK